MRPSDENQHRSKRPNLFSSSRRHAATDDNILARLERGIPLEAGAGGMRRPPVAVLAGGAVLVLGLIITLAILARDNAAPARGLRVATPEVIRMAEAPAQRETRASIVDEAPALVTLVPAPPEQPEPAPSMHMVAPAVAAAAPRMTKTVSVRPARAESPRSRAKPKPAGKPPAAKASRRPGAAAPEVDPDVAILTVILSQSARHTKKPAAGE